MSNPPAVILGGTLTALSVARSLTAAGIPVTVLDRRDSPVRVSRRRTRFVELDGRAMPDQMLAWLRSSPSGAVVLACADEGLELIARHRSELVDLGYIPMEANDDALHAMLDKRRTEEIAREHGIPAPRVLPLRVQADVERVIGEINFPCVLKPAHSHIFRERTKTGAKVLIVDGPDELHTVLERTAALGLEMLVVEVIHGIDDEFVSYFGYLDEGGASLLQFTKRKLRQDPIHFGIATYHATTHDPEVAELGLRFLRAARVRGIGNIEFKRDRSDGKLKLIECNLRFTMANELLRLAGIDLALFAYNRLLGRPTPPVDSYREDMRMWDPLKDIRAYLQYRRAGELTLRRWVGSLLYRQHFPTARLDDPLPALVRAARMVRREAARRASARIAASDVERLLPPTESLR